MVASVGASQLNAPTSKEFTCFPKLPIELRREIWMWACFHTRDVHLGTMCRSARSLPASLPVPIGIDTYRYYISRTPCPSILRTNQESRAEGLRWYALDFEVRIETDLYNFLVFPRIYVNWAADRICIDDDWVLDGIRDLENIFV
ncbi:hypothetical protein EG329_012371 [Mollisiaceae sp. DMI_Dod_QoI]|nr:hypothetical protein EG329_012371 [Helotiales sp. DMI_Dod_QoI]